FAGYSWANATEAKAKRNVMTRSIRPPEIVTSLTPNSGGEELVFRERHDIGAALDDHVAQPRRLHEHVVAVEARGGDLRCQEVLVARAHLLFGGECGARHLPAASDDAHELQERHSAGEGGARILALDDEV